MPHDAWIEASIIKDFNPINHYLTLWKAQCNHSFNLPNLFIYFYMLEDKSKVYAAANDYFAIFPERFELLAPVYRDLILETSFEKKNREYLSPCVEAGYFKAEDVASIMEMADILFGGILLQVLKHQPTPENKKNSIHSFFTLLDGLLTPYFLKDSNIIKDFIFQMEV